MGGAFGGFVIEVELLGLSRASQRLRRLRFVRREISQVRGNFIADNPSAVLGVSPVTRDRANAKTVIHETLSRPA